mgnify:FL=1
MITFEKGKKHEKDVVIKINGHKFTYHELAEVCVWICRNEDNIYPYPYQGGQKPIEFLVECMKQREVTDNILNRHQLNSENKPNVKWLFTPEWMSEEEKLKYGITETQKSSPEKKSLSGIIDFPVPAPPLPKSVEEKSSGNS